MPANLGEEGLKLQEVDRGRLLHLAGVDGVEELVQIAADTGQVAGELGVDRGHGAGELRAESGIADVGPEGKAEAEGEVLESLELRWRERDVELNAPDERGVFWRPAHQREPLVSAVVSTREFRPGWKHILLRRNRGGRGRFAVGGTRGAVGIGSAGKLAHCLERRRLQDGSFTRHLTTFVACRDPKGKADRSGLEIFPVLLGLPDQLGTGFAVASDKVFNEPIDLRFKSLLEGRQGLEATCRIPRRDVAFLGEAKKERLDGVAPQVG